MDWKQFHRLAIRGEYSEHVYWDYLEPILRILSSDRDILDYYGVVGESIDDFVKTLVDRMDDCFQTTKWPFSAMNSFGDLLYNLFICVANNNTKLRCLKGLWVLAYGNNQWHVQDIAKNVLESDLIPTEIQAEFGIYIMESGYEAAYEELAISKIPPIIRRAIRISISSKSNDDSANN